MGFEAKFIESKQPSDYEANIDALATEGYNIITTVTLQNGGVGLAAFHDWDSKIPADLKAKLQQASAGIMDGSINTQ